jgi:hypothetical protein
MVWKNNFMVEKISVDIATGVKQSSFELVTIEGFMDDFFPLCSFENPQDTYHMGLYLNEKHFPKNIIFANFRCLRCGLCCRNYDCEVEREQIMEWEVEGREDVLKYIWLPDGFVHGEIENPSWTGCPFCRKVGGKPYYYCRIQPAKSNLPVCKAYLCSKSIPIAHLNYEDVDELIEMIGLSGYYSLIERDWGEGFDYSRCEIKTHKKQK